MFLKERIERMERRKYFKKYGKNIPKVKKNMTPKIKKAL